jgi:hypothetical protein
MISVVRLLLMCCMGFIPAWSQTLPSQVTAEVLAADSVRFTEYTGSSIKGQIAAPENQNKPFILVSRTGTKEGPAGVGPGGSLRNWLAAKAANSDVVVIVTLLNQHSALTADHSFVFSDYEARVDRVLNDKTGHVLPGGNIIVSRAGGEAEFNGHIIRAIDPEFKPFRPNETYLLCMYQNPGSGTFKAFAENSFLITGSRAVSAKTHLDKFDDAFQQDPTFLSTIVDAVAIAKLKERAK